MMIRTTLSCCALFGCLLGITYMVRHPDSDALRPVERAPRLSAPPSSPEALPEPRVAEREDITRVSAEIDEDAPATALTLALHQPVVTTADPAPIVDAAEAAELLDESDDRIFQLLLEDSPGLVEYRISDQEFSSEESEESLSERQADSLENAAGDGGALASEEPAAVDSSRSRFDSEMLALRDELRACLSYYYNRPERADQRSPWGVMHALIAFGVDTQLIVDGRPVNAIGWLCWNRPCRGQKLFSTRGGQLQTAQGPGVQGHEGQFLAMLAQSRVRSDYELRVDGQRFTVADLVALEQRTCRPRSELTFKLIGLVHYLDSDATWICEGRQRWDIPRLIEEEMDQPVVGAACGGTHRMMGFSYAVRKREKRGEPLEGQWLRAKKYVDAYHDYTFKLQNGDGSFSTDWFRSREASPDIQRRVQTTGHILEWLVYSLPREDLLDPRVVRSVRYLTRLMTEHRQWEVGPRGHALHALVLYDERVFRAGEDFAGRTDPVSEETSPTARLGADRHLEPVDSPAK